LLLWAQPLLRKAVCVQRSVKDNVEAPVHATPWRCATACHSTECRSSTGSRKMGARAGERQLTLSRRRRSSLPRPLTAVDTRSAASRRRATSWARWSCLRQVTFRTATQSSSRARPGWWSASPRTTFSVRAGTGAHWRACTSWRPAAGSSTACCSRYWRSP